MDRRKFLINMGLISALPLLPSCSAPSSLNVGIQPWIGYETLYLANGFNWLPAELHLHTGNTAVDSVNGLLSGELDAACLTLDEVLRVRETGVPLTVVLVFDTSAGADVVMARNSIKNISDLKGKRIAVENSAVGALVLSSMLGLAGISTTSVEIIDCSAEQQLSLWKSGEVDAVVTYEPTASRLQAEGAHIIFDSRQIPDTIIDVLAIRDDLNWRKKIAVNSLVKGHFQGLNHIKSSRQDASYRIATHQKISVKEVQTALSGIVFPSLEANRSYLSTKNSQLLMAAKRISTLMVQSGLLEKVGTLDDLVSVDYLPKSVVDEI